MYSVCSVGTPRFEVSADERFKASVNWGVFLVANLPIEHTAEARG